MATVVSNNRQIALWRKSSLRQCCSHDLLIGEILCSLTAQQAQIPACIAR